MLLPLVTLVALVASQVPPTAAPAFSLDLPSIAAGMTILCALGASTWFVVRAAVLPVAVSLGSLKERFDQHDRDDRESFASLHRAITDVREDTGSHKVAKS